MAGSPGFDSKLLKKRLQFGIDSGGGMGAMMAFMGLPWNQKSGGQWNTYDPRNGSSYPMGTNPMGSYNNKPAGPSTGGDGPPLDDEEQKKEDLVKAGLAPWYVDWLNTSGQYGSWKKPPGLLG
jgi:hypothetical protein